MEFVKATKDLFTKEINFLLEIDRETIGQPWTIENFLYEAPQKWETSYLLYDSGILCGFCVCSLNEMTLHIHRIAISNTYRSRGYGSRFLKFIFEKANNFNCEFVTLKVSVNNERACNLYKQLGLKIVSADDQNYLMRLYLPDNSINK